jgi:protoheme ferro-lyase
VHLFPWAIALIASILSGLLLCGALVARRRTSAVFIVGAALALLAAFVSGRAIWAATGRLDALAGAVAISIGACGGGYALGAALLNTRFGSRERPIVLRPGPARPGTHVVLLSDEEPEAYDPLLVRTGLARYLDSDITLPPEVARPLIYASERSRYHRTGGSPARGVVRALAISLEARVRTDGTARDVSPAFCVGSPSLHEIVARIVADGGRRIIVAPLAAAWSRAFTQAIDAVPLPDLAALGVTIESARPLWASTDLSGMLARRVMAALGDDRSADGVVLVSEGDPWEHAKAHAEYREQLTFLIQRVRAELVAGGVAPDRIRRAWLWLESPDVPEAVRHLAAVGAHNIVLVPVTFPAQTISTVVDLNYAAEGATADTGAAVTVLAPWGDDPAVVSALARAIADVVGPPAAS